MTPATTICALPAQQAASPGLLPRPTLRQALADGHLPPLDLARTRAVLAGLDDVCGPADARRVLHLLLSRVREYYTAVDYTGPGYVFGRPDSECASAVAAQPSWDASSRVWGYPTYALTGAAASQSAVFKDAAAICLRTAVDVAAWELATAASEASWTLRQAAHSAYHYLTGHLLSGNWKDCRRRIGTAKARARVEQALRDLDTHVVVMASAHLAAVYTTQEFDCEREQLERQAQMRRRPLQVSMPLTRRAPVPMRARPTASVQPGLFAHA